MQNSLGQLAAEFVCRGLRFVGHRIKFGPCLSEPKPLVFQHVSKIGCLSFILWKQL